MASAGLQVVLGSVRGVGRALSQLRGNQERLHSRGGKGRRTLQTNSGGGNECSWHCHQTPLFPIGVQCFYQLPVASSIPKLGRKGTSTQLNIVLHSLWSQSSEVDVQPPVQKLSVCAGTLLGPISFCDTEYLPGRNNPWDLHHGCGQPLSGSLFFSFISHCLEMCRQQVLKEYMSQNSFFT